MNKDIIPISRIYRRMTRDTMLFAHVNLELEYGKTLEKAIESFIKKYCITDTTHESLRTSYRRMVQDFIQNPLV